MAAAWVLPCTLKPPIASDALRGEAEVAHHRDLGVQQGRQVSGALAAALQLHRLHASLAHQAQARAGCLAGIDMEAAVRQVDDDGQAGAGPDHRRPVMRHVVEGDLQCGVVAQQHLAQGVAHQQGVDAPGGGHPGGGDVVGGHDDQALVVAAGAAEHLEGRQVSHGAESSQAPPDRGAKNRVPVKGSRS